MTARDALRVALLFGLYGAARAVDAAVGLLLRSTLDLPDFVPRALSLVEPRALLVSTAGWAAAGVALAFVTRGCLDWRAFAPLLLRPALTLAALLALWVQPTYPYGSTLVVALTQDWSIAQDVVTVAALLGSGLATCHRDSGRATRWWRYLAPTCGMAGPDPFSLAFLAFLFYGLATPEWARHWDGHPGNEPKTLRQAVAIGHWLTLDMQPVSAGMEELDTGPLGARAADAVRTLGGETAALVGSLRRGDAFAREAIRATRETRQVVRGKDGGVFTVLAPGPSALLAPALRVDRALNRARGTPGRLAVTVLAWNALAALLVAALFLLVRDATGRPGLAALVAAVCAALPPFVFYAYQFYPEMPGALALAVMIRELLLRPFWSTRRCLALGLLLATLPWLHQKFLPVWAVLAVLAVVRAVSDLVTARGLAALVVPQLASGGLFLLYNFAITGSARPDALFLAWGPGGVAGARIGQGLLGLLLDARYGIVPYVPVLLLAIAGLALHGRPRAWLVWAGLPTAVYYVTVAAADNWSGATCNLGRYVMPALPFAILLAAAALAAAGRRAGAATMTLALTGLSAVFAWLLVHDPHAANDCQFLLARADFADGNVYVPNLFIRAWADAAPGLWVRIATWMALAAALAGWWRRTAHGRGGDSAPRAAFVAIGLVVAASLVLERWPSARRAPRFDDAIELGAGATAFLPGRHVREGYARVHVDEVPVLVRSREPREAVHVVAAGTGVLHVPGLRPLVLDTAGVEARLPLDQVAALEGRRGVREFLARGSLRVEGGPVTLTVRASE